ncbi:glycosyltransferase [Bacillus sp. AK128]
MKNILIASFDMEVGGVERSLISLLNKFDYNNYQVDLMLYSHTGDFMKLLPNEPNLLNEIPAYKTFRMSISEVLKKGNIPIGVSRILAKMIASIRSSSSEVGYKQMQYMWKYAVLFLPRAKKEYDVAISYLWPHYFVAEKVKAKTKIAWIHTDFSTVDTDTEVDLEMWNKFNYIAAVSDECKNAFIKKYPELKNKVIVIENITSTDIVESLSKEIVDNPMLEDQRFKIITVARLSHAKGIDQAVKALKQLKDKGYENISWYVVGYGGDEQVIRKLIEENDLENQFFLLGKRINPYPYIEAGDLYVQPSRYEGKAVTVVEAQILGKPVMITNYTTAKSQVINGVDGYICELSVEGIVEGIEYLYQSDSIRRTIADYCRSKDFRNDTELKKIYQII